MRSYFDIRIDIFHTLSRACFYLGNICFPLLLNSRARDNVCNLTIISTSQTNNFERLGSFAAVKHGKANSYQSCTVVGAYSASRDLTRTKELVGV